MRNVGIRTTYEIMPDMIQEAIREYLLKHYNVNVNDKDITKIGGNQIDEMFIARTSAIMERVKS